MSDNRTDRSVSDVEAAVIAEIKNNPGDIVNRLQRLNTTTRPDLIMAEVESAISEIISLRCQNRLAEQPDT